MCFFDTEDDLLDQYLRKKQEKHYHYWKMISKKAGLKRKEAAQVDKTVFIFLNLSLSLADQNERKKSQKIKKS